MIAALRGITFSFHKNPAIFFVGDVGYAVYITTHFAKTLEVNKKVLLFIHSHIREDAFDLYGFEKEDELALFELLLTVSGIGPKTALLVIDRGVDQIQHAVTKGDVDFFSSIPRLGRKNAQKIIIELKSKLGSVHELSFLDESEETKHVIDALVSMGFTKKEIIPVLQKVSTSRISLEQKIKEALQLLGT